jgi:hypothetical protein
MCIYVGAPFLFILPFHAKLAARLSILLPKFTFHSSFEILFDCLLDVSLALLISSFWENEVLSKFYRNLSLILTTKKWLSVLFDD